MHAWLYFSRPTNIAFHNLCLPSFKLPAGTRCLLGLGLSFCPRPALSNAKRDVDFKRFYRDCNTRMFFGNSPLTEQEESGLFVRSGWEPSPDEVPPEFRARVSMFIRRLGALFKRRIPTSSSFLPSQDAAFRWLQHHENIVVFPTDKNLGPAIMERDRYIRLAFTDHLNDPTTYRRLDKTTADRRIKTIRVILKKLIQNFKDERRPRDATYLQRTLDQMKDPFAYFYLLAKVHKTPISTRPIVSVSGSILYGLGKLVDAFLQRLCKRLPYRASSSYEVVTDLKLLENVSPSARLFTCDAKSMYTNINTADAIRTIVDYLQQHPNMLQAIGVSLDLFTRCLRTVMNHNVFRFGDTYWVQLSGTAMGTPPAPMYATLYFGILEQRFLPIYNEVIFYRRYIDDGFGIWVPQPGISPTDQNENWTLFMESFNTVSSLEWDFSSLETTVDFLDLTITIDDDGRLFTRLFEKALNLHLYLPGHSCHPPGVLKSLIYGTLLRCYRLSSHATTAEADVKRFLTRLVARGFPPSLVNGILSSALTKLHNKSMPTTSVSSNSANALFLHLPFHPLDPSSRDIQTIFRETMDHPRGEPPLSLLHNKAGVRFGNTRMIVAYSRPRNLGNFFSPRKLHPPGVNPSAFLESDEAGDAA